MIKYAFAATGLTYVIMMLTLYLTCRPYHKQWQVIPDPGSESFSSIISSLSFEQLTNRMVLQRNAGSSTTFTTSSVLPSICPLIS